MLCNIKISSVEYVLFPRVDLRCHHRIYPRILHIINTVSTHFMQLNYLIFKQFPYLIKLLYNYEVLLTGHTVWRMIRCKAVGEAFRLFFFSEPLVWTISFTKSTHSIPSIRRKVLWIINEKFKLNFKLKGFRLM